MDHVISRNHCGKGHPDNLALACYLCNRLKGATSLRFIPARGSWRGCFIPVRIVGQSIFALLVPS
ncbi:MAG: HNH endonuclease [Bryobacteraceae bacterium]